MTDVAFPRAPVCEAAGLCDRNYTAAYAREALRELLQLDGARVYVARDPGGSKRRKIAVMQPAQHSEQERPTDSPQTLGDVLYANQSKTPESEKGWVGLVQSIATGDQLALHALYERTHRIVFTLIMRITSNRETAEEVTLDVFHDVWRRAPRYNAANGTVLGWIMNQARSRAIDRLRFEQRKKRVDSHTNEPPPTIEAGDSYDVVELKERVRALRSALTTLTPDERRAIQAAFFSELTHAEVAARLNQPLGTVKTRIRSGLHKLRAALAVEAQRP